MDPSQEQRPQPIPLEYATPRKDHVQRGTLSLSWKELATVIAALFVLFALIQYWAARQIRKHDLLPRPSTQPTTAVTFH